MPTLLFHPGPPSPTPEQRLMLMNDVEWESFIEGCVDRLREEGDYVEVHRLGGAGDRGRDVCGYTKPLPEVDSWDLYQGKHYQVALSPSAFLPDAAKFIWNVFSKSYSRPRKYYVCSLRIGTSLFDLIKSPDDMRAWLLSEWKKKKGDFGSFQQVITQELETFIQSFPFSVFAIQTTNQLLSIHSRNPELHWEKFAILPSRDPNPEVPELPLTIEEPYVQELLAVYSEALARPQVSVSDIKASRFKKHLEVQRRLFYCAEGLNRFSRDKLPGAFDDLLDKVELGIATDLLSDHRSSLDRLTKVVSTAGTLQIATNPLRERINSEDLQGSCHHLVNLARMTWQEEGDDSI